MAAHANAVPYSGFSCLVCAARFSSKANLVVHWNETGHAPASMQRFRVEQARRSLTGQPVSIVPVGVGEEIIP